jgi:hypothetical protein
MSRGAESHPQKRTFREVALIADPQLEALTVQDQDDPGIGARGPEPEERADQENRGPVETHSHILAE